MSETDVGSNLATFPISKASSRKNLEFQLTRVFRLPDALRLNELSENLMCSMRANPCVVPAFSYHKLLPRSLTAKRAVSAVASRGLSTARET